MKKGQYQRDIAEAEAARVPLSRRRNDWRFPPLVRWKVRIRPLLTGEQEIPKNGSLVLLQALRRERAPATTLFHEGSWENEAFFLRCLRR